MEDEPHASLSMRFTLQSLLVVSSLPIPRGHETLLDDLHRAAFVIHPQQVVTSPSTVPDRTR